MSIASVAADTNLTPQTIRTCLNRLKSTNEITSKSTNKFTIITICNYDSYQAQNFSANKQINKQTNKQLTNKQQTTNKHNSIDIENIRDKENPSNKLEGQKKVFTPPTLDEIEAYIQAKNLSLDAERFYDFYESNGWMVGRNKMKDWRATARNWSREETRRRNEDNRSLPTRSTKQQRDEEFAAHIHQKLASS